MDYAGLHTENFLTLSPQSLCSAFPFPYENLCLHWDGEMGFASRILHLLRWPALEYTSFLFHQHLSCEFGFSGNGQPNLGFSYMGALNPVSSEIVPLQWARYEVLTRTEITFWQPYTQTLIKMKWADFPKGWTKQVQLATLLCCGGGHAAVLMVSAKPGPLVEQILHIMETRASKPWMSCCWNHFTKCPHAAERKSFWESLSWVMTLFSNLGFAAWVALFKNKTWLSPGSFSYLPQIKVQWIGDQRSTC